MSEAHRTLYFDIDGTLMVARGAGRSAFTQAFEDVYDKLIDISHINFAGATDLGIAGLIAGTRIGYYARPKDSVF